MNISITIGVTPQLEKALLGLTSLISQGAGASQSNATSNISAPVTPAVQQQVPQAPQHQVVPSAVPTAAPVQPVPMQVVQQPQQLAQQQVPIQQAPIQQPQEVPTTAPSYSMEQLAVAATQLVDAGRRDELLNLLASFGAPALMQLPKEQYGAFATKLREMGAKI